MIVVTAALVVAYTALFESGAKVPFDDDVFTTWPSPCSSSTGTNVLMPWMTPNTLTSTAQRQSFTWCSHSAPSEPDGIAGVVAHEVDGAERSTRRVAQRAPPTRARTTSVTTPITASPHCARQLVDRGVEQRLVDVGEHDLHALGEEALAERPSDAAAATGDDGDLPPEVLHGSTVTQWPPNRQTERYTVISADCHAGADLRDYRPFLEARVPRRVRRLGRPLRQPVRRPRQARRRPQLGQHRAACATSRPTASSPRSSTRTPCRRSSPRAGSRRSRRRPTSSRCASPACAPTTAGSPRGAPSSPADAPASARSCSTTSTKPCATCTGSPTTACAAASCCPASRPARPSRRCTRRSTTRCGGRARSGA